MRLFVAVDLPDAVVSAAATISDTLRRRVRDTAPTARLTWIAPERMHLTLRFIGEVPPEAAARIGERLATPFETTAFTVAAGETGTFPARGAPRVVWIGLREGREALHQLEAEVSSRLEQAGIAREPRPFSPHLTLARVREAGGLRASTVAGVRAPDSARGQVDAVTLFESRLSPKGPAYSALHRIRLR